MVVVLVHALSELALPGRIVTDARNDECDGDDGHELPRKAAHGVSNGEASRRLVGATGVRK